MIFFGDRYVVMLIVSFPTPATFEDHAFQQPAFQISTDPVFAVASSAVDGNTTTFAKTKHHTFPLWYVDLGESKVVRHLQITFHDTQRKFYFRVPSSL